MTVSSSFVFGFFVGTIFRLDMEFLMDECLASISKGGLGR
jgi:hypothetical protein